MLKRIFTTIVLAITCFSCSNLHIQETSKIDENFIEYYDNWELQKMEDILIGLEDNGEVEEFLKYSVLFEERKKMEADLIDFVDDVKNKVCQNDIDYLAANMKSSMRNKKVLNELSNINFEALRVFVSKPEFSKKAITNVVGLNFSEETFYFDIEYEFEIGKWLISDFRERR